MQSVFPPDDPGDPPLLLLNLGRDLLCLILSRTGELDILAIVLACKEIRAAAISPAAAALAVRLRHLPAERWRASADSCGRKRGRQEVGGARSRSE